MIRAFSEGVGILAEGARLIRLPAVKPFVWGPLLIGMAVFAGVSWFSIAWLAGWITGLDFAPDLVPALDWLEPVLAGLGSVFKWLLIACAVLLVLFFSGSASTLLSQVVAAPFLGLLAERVEDHLRPGSRPSIPLRSMIVRSFRREIHKFLYWGIRALGLGLLTLVLWFVPGLNVLGTVLWYVFGAWMMAAQYVDIVADNQGKPFTEVLATLRRHRAATLGFGGAVMVLASLPVVNLFIVPAAVAGGVIFWLRVH
jgi:CysZ protein